jgi:predicted dehydrogenase
MNQFRIGIASLVHDHVWGELAHWRNQPEAQVVAVGETDPRLLARFREMFPDARVHPGWKALLDSEAGRLDIVQIAAENSAHADIAEAAFAAGCHVITEKPMAAKLSQANRMLAASEKAGKVLMVNWPTAWSPAWQEFLHRIQSGEIGTPRYVRYRSAHNGPKEIGCDPAFVEWLYDEERNGAGAYMDYCCYGAVLCAALLGRPNLVQGTRAVLAKDYPIADDNAIVTMQYRHAYGVAEASWSQVVPTVGANPVAYGSEGAISVEGGLVVVYRAGEGREVIEPKPLQSPRSNGPEYLLHCIASGIEPEGICNARISGIAQEILEAGLRSADSGARIALPVT